MTTEFNISNLDCIWKNLSSWEASHARQSWNKFLAVNLPTHEQVEWSQANLGPWKKNWKLEQSTLESEKEILKIKQNIDAQSSWDIVIIDGNWIPKLSTLPENLIQTGQIKFFGPQDLDQEKREQFLLDLPLESSMNPLAEALRQGGLWIEVAKNICLEKDIHLIFLNTWNLSSRKTLIKLGQSAKANFVEHHVNDNSQGLTLNKTIFQLEPNSQVTHIHYNQNDSEQFFWNNNYVDVASNASYTNFIYDRGSNFFNDLCVNLNGHNAQTDCLELAQLKDNNQSHHTTLINHKYPHTNSFQLYKNILDGSSHSTFFGKIHVHASAELSNARQLNRNLLLTAKAKAHTTPQLLIDNNDVKCSHGATVGQLNPEETFYLESRGLSPKEAKNLLIQGLAQDVIMHLPKGSLQEFAQKLLAQRSLS